MGERGPPGGTSGVIEMDGCRIETIWWAPKPAHAPTLVLLHEGLGCAALWRDVPERLAAATGCGVFAYSRLGYGQSSGAVLPRPMDYMHQEAIDGLPRVLTAAGIKRAVLIGHSDGGSIAAIHAGAVRDSTVTAIVLIAAHFFVEELNLEAIRQIKNEYETTGLREKLARYHADVDGTFRGWNDAWLDPRFRDFNISGYLRDITVPVLGLQGTDDPYGSEAQLDTLTTHVRSALETCLIPGARHSPHLEAKDLALSTITNFIRTHLPELRS